MLSPAWGSFRCGSKHLRLENYSDRRKLSSKLLIHRDLWLRLKPEEQAEDDRRRHDSDHERDAEQRGGDRTAEVQRPAAAVARRHEKGGVERIVIQVAEPPVFGNEQIGRAHV